MTDKRVLYLINEWYSEGDLIKNRYSIIRQLKLPYVTAEDKAASRTYLKRFVDMKPMGSGIYKIVKIRSIKEIKEYDAALSAPKKKQPTKKVARGYDNDDKFMELVKDKLKVGIHFKGYRELCTILNVPYKRHKSQQDVQKKDWSRFFSIKENSLHDWVITSVNDEPVLDLKVTRSVYGNNASCIIAKSLHENEDELKKAGKACIVDKDGSYEVFMSGKEMNRLIGVNSYTDYTPLSYDQIAEIDKEMAEKYEDKELNYMEQIQRDLELKKDVSAEIPDIDLFIKQFPAKARSIIGSTLNNLKWKNIAYYSYTELYTNLNTGKSDVLLRDKNLLNEVLSIRQKVLDKYGLKDERSVFYVYGGKYRTDYFNDLNEALRSELGVKVFRGYYIFIHPGHLKKYYDRMKLEGKPLDIFRKELYEKIRKQQLLTAKEYTAKADKIADEGYGEMLPALSDDYEAVSDALMDMLIPYTDLGSEFEYVDMFLPMETLEDIAESGGLEARGPLSRLG